MDSGVLTCPHCAAPLDATPGESPQNVACPHCGGLTIIPAVDGTVETVTYAAPPLARDDELSSFRIRQLAAARRAAYRSRSYCVVGALVCVVAVVQLMWTAIRVLRATGFGWRPAAYVLIAVLAAWGAFYFFRKAMELDREARRSSLPATTGEPDFTPLSDGSQRWKNLEDIR